MGPIGCAEVLMPLTVVLSSESVETAFDKNDGSLNLAKSAWRFGAPMICGSLLWEAVSSTMDELYQEKRTRRPLGLVRWKTLG